MMLQRPKYKSFSLKAGPHKINNKSVAVTTFPHCAGLFLTSISSGGSRGGARGGPPPLFFDQNEAQLAKNNFFGDRPTPPYLRVWMTGPSPYLKVWILH